MYEMQLVANLNVSTDFPYTVETRGDAYAVIANTTGTLLEVVDEEGIRRMIIPANCVGVVDLKKRARKITINNVGAVSVGIGYIYITFGESEKNMPMTPIMHF